MTKNDTDIEAAIRTTLIISLSKLFCMMSAKNPKLTRNDIRCPKTTFRGCAKEFSGAPKSKIAVAPRGGKSKATGKFNPRNPIIRKQAKIPMLADNAKRN
jgi:hypothetical protein